MPVQRIAHWVHSLREHGFTVRCCFVRLFQDHTDAELVSLLRNGDKAAFEAIYRRYAADLYRYARKNVSVPEDCEEIVQDVFESLWIRHENLKSSRSAITFSNPYVT